VASHHALSALKCDFCESDATQWQAALANLSVYESLHFLCCIAIFRAPIDVDGYAFVRADVGFGLSAATACFAPCAAQCHSFAHCSTNHLLRSLRLYGLGFCRKRPQLAPSFGTPVIDSLSELRSTSREVRSSGYWIYEQMRRVRITHF